MRIRFFGRRGQLLRHAVSSHWSAADTVGIAGKVAAGFAVFGPRRVRRLVIGVGMVPRGEVGLIFAQLGLATGLLSSGLYSSLALMVIVTTLVAPPALRALLKPGGERDQSRHAVGARH